MCLMKDNEKKENISVPRSSSLPRRFIYIARVSSGHEKTFESSKILRTFNFSIFPTIENP